MLNNNVFKLKNVQNLFKNNFRYYTLTKKSIKSDGQSPGTDETNEDVQTHFGFQNVNIDEKVDKVHKVFEDVAGKYDLMNDAMSFGVQRIWKDIFMERLGPTNDTKLLDMAGGTGDIAFRYIKYLQNSSSGSVNRFGGHVTIGDINQNMLNFGMERAKQLGYTNEVLTCLHHQGDDSDKTTIIKENHAINWTCVNAEELPFSDNSYNAYTIAFGIRNCTHIDRVLNEAYRVLQPGGRFMCLEFSQLNNDILQWIYDQYSFTFIPPIGQILAGQWDAYQYLIESIRKFPKKDDFKKMIENAGFVNVVYEDLSFGICCIHSGFKI